MLNTIMIGLALASVQADATFARNTDTSVISIADLDLTTSVGKTLLARRIRNACGNASNVDLEGIQSVHACRDDAWEQAMYVAKSRLSQRPDVQLAVR